MSQQTHKILSIQPQKRHKNRFTVTLESGDVFGISEDVFISDRLAVGQELTTGQLSDILEKETIQKIKIKAITLLSYRQRSRAELFRRLNEKFDDKNFINLALDELTNNGYINDFEFAKMMISHLVVQKKLGRRAILNEMKQHQIESNKIDRILEKVFEKYPPESTVKLLVEKRMKYRDTSQKEKQKLVNYLTRKGFFWDEIEPGLQEISWKTS